MAMAVLSPQPKILLVAKRTRSHFASDHADGGRALQYSWGSITVVYWRSHSVMMKNLVPARV